MGLSIYITLLVLFLHSIQGNNYDPHYPSSGEGLWFEGWYTRIVDFQNNRSFASVFGSYCAKETNCNNMQGLPGYLAFVYQEGFSSQFKVIETYPNETYIEVGPNKTPVKSDPSFSSPPDFQWSSLSSSLITNGSIALSLGDYSFKAVMSDPLFWNPSNPGEGPEGMVMDLPLQQHWFVYSLGSAISYTFVTPDGSFSGTGYAHQEKNWGSSFPMEWVWAEGISGDNEHHFALSGGEVPIGPVGVHAWLVGYRSPNVTLNFRPQDVPTIFTPMINGCNGTFVIESSHLSDFLRITITAPVDTFTDLAIPTENGFMPNGCVESYAAVATAQVYKWGSLIEEYTFPNAALEFGGKYLCNSTL